MQQTLAEISKNCYLHNDRMDQLMFCSPLSKSQGGNFSRMRSCQRPARKRKLPSLNWKLLTRTTCKTGGTWREPKWKQRCQLRCTRPELHTASRGQCSGSKRVPCLWIQSSSTLPRMLCQRLMHALSCTCNSTVHNSAMIAVLACALLYHASPPQIRQQSFKILHHRWHFMELRDCRPE